MARLSRHSLFAALTALGMLSASLAFSGTAAAAPTATPAATCSKSAYAYAGVSSNSPAPGIATTLTALAAAHVPYGHVAGWIGIGGANAGPGGQAEWLQTGIVTEAGNGNQLYAEITRPGSLPHYVTLASGVEPGQSYALAIVGVTNRPGVWQVLVDGKPATAPIVLPGSRSFAPMAMSESWNGGVPACNGFAYRFDRLRVATASGSWTPLTNSSTLADTGYRVLDHTTAGFTAMSA